MKAKINIFLLFVIQFIIFGCAATNTPKKIDSNATMPVPLSSITKPPSKMNTPEVMYTPNYSYDNASIEKESLKVFVPQVISKPQIKEEEPIQAIDEKQKDNDGLIRVAVLLPLSGKAKSVGESLKNAAQMGLFDINDSRMVLQFYDTKGEKHQAGLVARQAISQGSDIIVGPLFSECVKEVGSIAKSKGINVISFTTDSSVLSSNVYSLNYLLDQEVDRVISYAIQKGLFNISVIIPDNNDMGDVLKSAIRNTASKYGINIYDFQTYDSEDSATMVEAVKKVANFEKRNEDLKALKQASNEIFADCKSILEELKNLTDEEKELREEKEEETYCLNLKGLNKSLEGKSTIGKIDMDAIFIGGSISDTISIGSYLMYYDVHPDKVKFLGTGVWDNKKIIKERAFFDGWFATKTDRYSANFKKSYKKYFGKKPIKIATLAYDAIALISGVAKEGVIDEDLLIDESGFLGVSGLFRFIDGGLAERTLDVRRVIPRRIRTKTLLTAEKSFQEFYENINEGIRLAEEALIEKENQMFLEEMALIKQKEEELLKAQEELDQQQSLIQEGVNPNQTQEEFITDTQVEEEFVLDITQPVSMDTLISNLQSIDPSTLDKLIIE